MKRAACLVTVAFMMIIVTACMASSPTPTPPPPPKTATRLAIVPTVVAPTTVSQPTATAEPSATPVPTLALPTTTPMPPTPVIPSGLFITSLQTIPEIPTRGTDLIFYATFANNTSTPITFRWVVRIFTPGNFSHSFGQTTTTLFTDLTPGAKNQTSLGSWRLPLGGPCENFSARVYFIDQNNQESPMKQPNGQIFEKSLTVCPPSEVPTATLAPATATPTPVSAPGLYVTGIRTEPQPPTRGSDLAFFVTFNNTNATVQSYRWRILIYRPDNPTRSYSDTAIAQSSLPTGTSEHQVPGTWKLALGGPCEDFILRVVWFDQNNVATPFTASEGKLFEKNLTLCPP